VIEILTLEWDNSAVGCDDKMKRILILFFVIPLALAQTKPTPPTYTMISVQRLTVGEAFDCPSIDMQWLEGHCFSPTDENLRAPKHKYLVTVTFDRAVETDKDGWAWDFTCRLDSYKAATCRVNKRTKPEN
jgi:hypothetical protein